MNKIKFLAISLLLVAFSCTNNNKNNTLQMGFKYNVKPESVGFSTDRLSYIDSMLSKYTANGTMPNAVTFVARHGKVVHCKAYGYKNIENKEVLKTSDIFRIASQTKAITTVALMQLFEEGKFLLDEPVYNYIPEFKNMTILDSLNKTDSSYTVKPAKTAITIRHLLSHTSGIVYETPITVKAKIPIINSLDSFTAKSFCQSLSKLPLNHEPGKAFTYGLNTDVVGHLIEVISGMPLDVYMKTRIFEPLQMNDTYFYLPNDKVERLVTLYAKDSMNAPLYKSNDLACQTYPYSGAKTFFSGGAGLVGPIEDYAKFCQMMLNGGTFNGKRIIGRKTIDLMTTNQIGDLIFWEPKNRFSLGFELINECSISQLPGSAGSYKWGGAYSTDYLIDPKEDLIMLIYTNARPFPNPDINKRFRVLVYQALNP